MYVVGKNYQKKNKYKKLFEKNCMKAIFIEKVAFLQK